MILHPPSPRGRSAGLSFLLASLVAFPVALRCGSPAHAEVPATRIVDPIPYQVIQREGFDPEHAQAHEIGGPKLGYADVPIAAEFARAADGSRVDYRVVPLSVAFGHGSDWTPLDGQVQAGKLRTTARVAAGGWYRLELRCHSLGRDIQASVVPIGIGEVFVVAGQSYAAGANSELLKIEDPQGRVVAYDMASRSWRLADDPLPNVDVFGNIWPALGNDLLPLLRVPIGFVDVAVGGTSSDQWLPGEKLYQRLATAGNEVGRFRAVLWQQGESDVGHASAAVYVRHLVTIRRSLEEEWGFSPPWLPAKSTFHPFAYDRPEQEEVIREAIQELWSQPGFFPGPDTDILGGENRARHFTGIGQRRAALLWFASIWQLLNPPPRR